MAFVELNIGVSGLFAAQKGLAVTANNISNAATTGYSRQRLQQTYTGMVGTTSNIIRIRDSYIDTKIWRMSDRLQENSVKTEQGKLMEDILSEYVDGRFVDTYSQLFESLDEVMKDPTSTQNKTTLVQVLQSFTSVLNQSVTELESMQDDLNMQLKAKVTEINHLAEQIQSLNKQIYVMERTGSSANDLRDERERCIDALSSIVNIEVTEREVKDVDGREYTQLVIKANGQTLVDHYDRRELELVANENNHYEVQWKDGAPFPTNSSLSGELKGILDIRDGAGGSEYAGIPYYINQLDTFVETFATKLNEIYDTGIDEATGEKVRLNQYELFDSSNLKAKGFNVSADLLADSNSLRTDFAGDGSGDLMKELIGVKDDTTLFGTQSAQQFVSSMSNKLAVDIQSVEKLASSDTTLMQQLTNQRLSTMQVDSNEEFMLLTAYQQAYQNAAKVITTMDSIYDITINKLGSW